MSKRDDTDELRNLSDDMAALLALDIAAQALQEFVDKPQMLEDRTITLRALTTLCDMLKLVLPKPGTPAAVALAAVKRTSRSVDYRHVRKALDDA